MKLPETIAAARRKKGFTQEELAELTSVTVRTIQRIESGESIPRKFTLKAIATALEIPFEALNTQDTVHVAPVENSVPASTNINEDTRHFLELFCLSCFAYIALPFVHFLVPGYLMKKRNEQDRKVIDFARKLIRTQIYWTVATPLLLLLTVAYNLFQAAYLGNHYFLHYLWPFFFMYALNAVIISVHLIRIRRKGILLEYAA